MADTTTAAATIAACCDVVHDMYGVTRSTIGDHPDAPAALSWLLLHCAQIKSAEVGELLALPVPTVHRLAMRAEGLAERALLTQHTSATDAERMARLVLDGVRDYTELRLDELFPPTGASRVDPAIVDARQWGDAAAWCLHQLVEGSMRRLAAALGIAERRYAVQVRRASGQEPASTLETAESIQARAQRLRQRYGWPIGEALPLRRFAHQTAKGGA